MIKASRTLIASDEAASSERIVRTRACVHRFLLALLLAGAGACAGGAHADIDPLHSPECEAAQAALEHAMQDAAGGSAAAREALGAARHQAMEACLGPQTGHDQRSGAPSIPVQVHSPALAAQEGKPAPEAAAPSAPMHIPRPVAITTCDPGGCWDSKGNRLNFMGPVLIGPHGGVCTTQAGAVTCPQ